MLPNLSIDIPFSFAHIEPTVKSNQPDVEVLNPGTFAVLPEDVAAIRRKGAATRIDRAWRLAIRARMDELRINAAELVRLTGSNKSVISEALSLTRDRPSSRWVDAIHHALGLEAPLVAEVRSRAGAVVVVRPQPDPGTPAVARSVAAPVAHAPPSPRPARRKATAHEKPKAVTPHPRRKATAAQKRALARTLAETLSDEMLDAWLAWFRDMLGGDSRE